MAKQDISIEDLVGKINRGEIVLPEMQRRYVWTAVKVRDLLDSLYRKYPSGTVLVWENEGSGPSRNLDIQQDKSPYSTQLILLDGQQRLTSLTALLSGKPVSIRGVKKPVEIMFNLDHPEDFLDQDMATEDELDEAGTGEEDSDDEVDGDLADVDGDIQNYLQQLTFVVFSKALIGKQNWIRVTDIFQKTDSQILKQVGLSSDSPDWDRYQQRINRVREIKKYSYVMHILGKEYDYNEVTEIFVRVNSSGVKLRSSDLALAQITAKWPGSLKLFEDFASEAKKYGYEVDVGLLVRLLVVYATNQARFKTVNSLSIASIQAAWEEAKRGANYALHFLRSNTGMESMALLSSPFIVIPIALLSTERNQNLTADEERELTRWIYLAHAFGHYSRGSSESILEADISLLRRRAGGAVELQQLLVRQFGRTKFDVGDLKARELEARFSRWLT